MIQALFELMPHYRSYDYKAGLLAVNWGPGTRIYQLSSIFMSRDRNVDHFAILILWLCWGIMFHQHSLIPVKVELLPFPSKH